MIRSLGLSGFFLLHRDMLELAREVAAEVRGADAARAVLPPGRGRGSSVASVVCFLTGLSHVDPVEKKLSLGRFLNEDLKALPDIDLDFPRDIREVLIPRVHERYGHDRSALVASFSTYRNRSAIRDFGKALGLPAGEIERAARAADPWNGGDLGEDFAQALGRARVDTPRWRALVRLVQDANNLPRHVSQHPGGMVISTRPLVDICPIQPAAMEGRQMVHWDKESCADAGFLKIDLLGLGMLSAVERCVSEIARTRDEVIDLSRIDFEDEARLSIDPARRHDRHVPDREPRADADARPDEAGVARRPDRAGRARPARADHRRRGPSLHRAAQGAARGPGATGSPTSTRRSSRCSATRSARSSSRTR